MRYWPDPPKGEKPHSDKRDLGAILKCGVLIDSKTVEQARPARAHQIVLAATPARVC